MRPMSGREMRKFRQVTLADYEGSPPVVEIGGQHVVLEQFTDHGAESLDLDIGPDEEYRRLMSGDL